MQNKILSVTDLTSWLYCPRKLYFTKIKKFKQPLNKLMIIGKLKHNILEEFSKTEKQLITQIEKDYDRLELFLIYENFLKRIANQVFLKNNKLIEAFRVNRAEIFKKVLEDFSEDIKIRIDSIKQGVSNGFLGEELWEKILPKYISELRVESSSLGLRGRIDRVEVNKENNTIFPYELKTRAGKYYYSDEIQLTAYAMLLQEFYNQPIEYGIIESGGKKEKLKIKQENKDKVLEIAEKIRNLTEDTPPQLPSNFNKCKNCGFKKYCF